MKIAFVANLDYSRVYGGQLRGTLTHRLLARNHTVEQLNTLNSADCGTPPDDLDVTHFGAIPDGVPGARYVRPLQIARSVRKYCSQADFDLVFTNNTDEYNLLAAWACQQTLDVPLVLTVLDHHTGTDFNYLYKKIAVEWLAPKLQQRADLLVFESETLQSSMPSAVYSDTPTVELPTAIDVERFQREEVDAAARPTVFYVGRDSDIELLFESAHRVAADVPNVEFRIAGVDESAYPHIDEEYIEFLGYVPDEKLPTEINRADVCVVPYSEERTAGRPHKLIEYMAAGSCVVVTDLEHNTQMVEHGENGLVASPNPETFATELRRALLDDDLRERLGERARQEGDEYSIPKMEERLENILSIATET